MNQSKQSSIVKPTQSRPTRVPKSQKGKSTKTTRSQDGTPAANVNKRSQTTKLEPVPERVSRRKRGFEPTNQGLAVEAVSSPKPKRARKNPVAPKHASVSEEAGGIDHASWPFLDFERSEKPTTPFVYINALADCLPAFSEIEALLHRLPDCFPTSAEIDALLNSLPAPARFYARFVLGKVEKSINLLPSSDPLLLLAAYSLILSGESDTGENLLHMMAEILGRSPEEMEKADSELREFLNSPIFHINSPVFDRVVPGPIKKFARRYLAENLLSHARPYFVRAAETFIDIYLSTQTSTRGPLTCACFAIACDELKFPVSGDRLQEWADKVRCSVPEIVQAKSDMRELLGMGMEGQVPNLCALVRYLPEPIRDSASPYFALAQSFMTECLQGRNALAPFLCACFTVGCDEFNVDPHRLALAREVGCSAAEIFRAESDVRRLLGLE